MSRDALDKFFERGILALVLAILVFAPLGMGAVAAPEFLIVQALAVGILFLWMLRLWFSRKPQLLWPPVCWVVLAFTIYAILRYLTADIEYVARMELIQVLICAFLFFAIVNNLYRQEFSQVISFTLIFVALGISVYAVFQFLTHSNRVWIYTSPYPGRASGTYISPNNLACFLEMLLPLATAYVLAGRMKAITRVLLGYAALVMAAGMVVTFSRGGWTAVVIAIFTLLVIVIFHRNHRLPAVLLLIALIAGGAVFTKFYLAKTITYMQRVEQTFRDNPEEVLDVRLDLWKAAIAMWRDHFWWGVGPAHYDYRFREYRPEKVQARPDRAHNDYLNLLADWGSAGGIVVLTGMIIFCAGLAKSWRHVRRLENDFGSGKSNRYAFFIGASMGLLALTIHSVVDFNLHIPANAILGITLLALLTSNLRFSTESYWSTARLPVKIPFTISIIAVIVYLSVQGWRRTNETIWLARAKQLPTFSTERVQALEKAFSAEPKNFETAYDVGEAYREKSFIGNSDYESLAKDAMQWYERAWKLDCYDSYDYLRYGMCLDWLNRFGEAENYFDEADKLDPNGYYTLANIGWHYAQAGNFATARMCLIRSIRLHWQENTIANTYLQIVESKMVAQAAQKP